VLDRHRGEEGVGYEVAAYVVAGHELTDDPRISRPGEGIQATGAESQSVTRCQAVAADRGR
jgi:hypothetical protein